MDNASRPLLWQTTDPRGLKISLSRDSWEHCITSHPEIADFLAEVQLTVRDPDAIYFDPKSTESRVPGTRVFWYVKAGVLSGRLQDDLMSVVVKVVRNNDEGFVSTALPIDKPLTRLVREWKKN